MPDVSIVIAARNERHLPRMLDHLYSRLTGDYEIIVVQDGPPYIEVKEHKRLTVINGPYQGLKPSINQAAQMARGKWLFKMDAHCAVSEGIDEILARDCKPEWMMVPRFYTMDGDAWDRNTRKPHNDYWLLDCPLTDPKGYRFRAGGYWFERTTAKSDVYPFDETMTHHGSAWFVSRDFFLNKLRGMQSEGYGVSYMEPADLGLRMWLGPWDGRVIVHKGCWYAHLHQQADTRGYGISMREIHRAYEWTANYWMRNGWPEAVQPLSWLIERFWPIPSWPDNWQQLQREYELTHPWEIR